LAADILAENSHLTYKFLMQDLYEYLDASIMVQTSPEEAYRKFDDLTNKHIDQLRKLTKAIQDARIQRDNDAIKQVSGVNQICRRGGGHTFFLGPSPVHSPGSTHDQNEWMPG